MSQFVRIRITAENRDAVNKLRETGRVQDDIADKGVKGNARLQAGLTKTVAKIGAMAAAYVGVRAIQREVLAMIDAHVEKEADMHRLGTVIEMTGLSWGILEDHVRGSLGALQEVTTFSDQELSVALQNLITLTGSYSKATERLDTVMRMAASPMFNLETASRYVAMAMEGNYNMLSRYVPALRGLDEMLGETATESEKIAYVFDVLNEKFADATEMADTHQAKLIQLKNATSDMLAEIGDRLTPAFIQLKQAIYDGSRAWAELFGLMNKNDRKMQATRDIYKAMTDEQLTAAIDKEKKRIENAEEMLSLNWDIEKIIEKQRQALEEINNPLTRFIQGQRLAYTVMREGLDRVREGEQDWRSIISSSNVVLDNLKKEAAARAEVNAELQRAEQLERERERAKRLEMVRLAQLEEEERLAAERLKLEEDLSKLRLATNVSLLSAEDAIRHNYAERLEFAQKMGDTELYAKLKYLELMELQKIQMDEIGEISKELTDQQMDDIATLSKELTDQQMMGAQLVADVLYEGMGGAFDNIERMFKNMIKRMIAEAIVLAAIMRFTGAPISGFGLGKILFPSAGLDRRAGGGPVTADRPYIVGERGHELFVPTTSGTIINNNATNNLIDNSQVVQELRSLKQAIYQTALTDEGVSRAAERGDMTRNRL